MKTPAKKAGVCHYSEVAIATLFFGIFVANATQAIGAT